MDEGPDPVVMVRRVADRVLEATANVADDVLSSGAFAASLAQAMNTSAVVGGVVRNSLHRVGESAAGWLNVPTRRQLIDLAARLNHVELVLDDVDMRTITMLDGRHGGKGDD